MMSWTLASSLAALALRCRMKTLPLAYCFVSQPKEFWERGSKLGVNSTELWTQDVVKMLTNEHTKQQGKQIMTTATTSKSKMHLRHSALNESYQCTYCGKAVNCCWTQQKNKGHGARRGGNGRRCGANNVQWNQYNYDDTSSHDQVTFEVSLGCGVWQLRMHVVCRPLTVVQHTICVLEIELLDDTDGSVTMCQRRYVDDILTWFGMNKWKSVKSPREYKLQTGSKQLRNQGWCSKLWVYWCFDAFDDCNASWYCVCCKLCVAIHEEFSRRTLDCGQAHLLLPTRRQNTWNLLQAEWQNQLTWKLGCKLCWWPCWLQIDFRLHVYATRCTG